MSHPISRSSWEFLGMPSGLRSDSTISKVQRNMFTPGSSLSLTWWRFPQTKNIMECLSIAIRWAQWSNLCTWRNKFKSNLMWFIFSLLGFGVLKDRRMWKFLPIISRKGSSVLSTKSKILSTISNPYLFLILSTKQVWARLWSRRSLM